MQVSISDRLYFHKAPDSLKDALDDHFKIPNPTYLDVCRFSASGGRYTQVPEFIRMLETVNDQCFALPRSVILPSSAVAKYAEVDIQDQRERNPVKFPALRVTLNPMQKKLHEAFRKECAAEIPSGFLLVAGTAFGKTIGMLQLAATAGQRTIVLTHRKLIFDVWIEEIKKVFGWEYPCSEVGKIQGPLQHVGTHITVAMLQTLHSRYAGAMSLLNSFGTVILDEAHICPAPYIQKVVAQCPALYRIGGTATIERKDGMQKILFWHFGKPFFKSVDTSTVKANQIPIDEVRLVKTKFCYEPEEEDIFNIHDLNHQVIFSGERNKLIVRNVIDDLKGGHYVLVTSSFKKHVHFLAKRLRDAGYPPIVFTGERAQGKKVFDEEVKLLQRGKRRLVVATEQLIREGTNIPPLNRLHVAFPMGDRGTATQLFGRIQRASGHTNKSDAKVTLYLDILTPSLRRRVMRVMIPALRKLGVVTPEMWIA